MIDLSINKTINNVEALTNTFGLQSFTWFSSPQTSARLKKCIFRKNMDGEVLLTIGCVATCSQKNVVGSCSLRKELPVGLMKPVSPPGFLHVCRNSGAVRAFLGSTVSLAPVRKDSPALVTGCVLMGPMVLDSAAVIKASMGRLVKHVREETTAFIVIKVEKAPLAETPSTSCFCLTVCLVCRVSL